MPGWWFVPPPGRLRWRCMTCSTHGPIPPKVWLALRNITADWGRAAKEWRATMNQFAIAYGERFIRTPA